MSGGYNSVLAAAILGMKTDRPASEHLLQLKYYGDPVLETPCADVTEFNEDLRTLCDMMHEKRREWQGLELAAPQVGANVQLTVIGMPAQRANDGTQTIIPGVRLDICNPSIIDSSDLIIMQEGCLSVPGFFCPVKRFNKVTVRYQNTMGTWCEIKAEGLLAQCLQHEIDHLNGRLFISGDSKQVKKAAMRATQKYLGKQK